MSRHESPEARAERILIELRAATSEAAGVLKDLTKVIASARGRVEEYLHDEVERALIENTQSMIDTAHKVCAEHEKKVVERVVGYAALIEANFGREPLIREAASRIERLVMDAVREREAGYPPAGPGITISVCDRPHAD